MARADDRSAGDPEGPGPLAFLLGREALVRRFLLAELLAPPVSMRRRTRPREAPPVPPAEAAPPRGERR
jgi:hypothetical protein